MLRPQGKNEKSSQPGPSRTIEQTPAHDSITEDVSSTTAETGTTGDTQTSITDWQEAKSPEGYTYYWNTVTNGKF